MSFRGCGFGGGGRNSFGGGRCPGGGRGRGRDGGGRNNLRGGRGGGRNFDQGPSLIPLGYCKYTCQNDLVCKSELKDVPFFNAPIYLQNMEQIGKIDEIFGNIRNYYVSVRLEANIEANSFNKNEKLFIQSEKLLPLKRFLPLAGSSRKREGRGGGRGRRGGFSRGGFGRRVSFGAGRGAFSRGKGGRGRW